MCLYYGLAVWAQQSVLSVVEVMFYPPTAAEKTPLALGTLSEP